MMADKVCHYLVESCGQEAQVVHGVFPTEAEAVELAERLTVEFRDIGRYDSPLGWHCQSRLTVQKWQQTSHSDVCEWRNTDEYTDDGRWVTEEEYDRLREEDDAD